MTGRSFADELAAWDAERVAALNTPEALAAEKETMRRASIRLAEEGLRAEAYRLAHPDEFGPCPMCGEPDCDNDCDGDYDDEGE